MNIKLNKKKKILLLVLLLIVIMVGIRIYKYEGNIIISKEFTCNSPLGISLQNHLSNPLIPLENKVNTDDENKLFVKNNNNITHVGEIEDSNRYENVTVWNTCISDLGEFEQFKNLKNLQIIGSNITTLQGISGMTNLDQLVLKGDLQSTAGAIDTIENIENIKGKPGLSISIYVDDVKYITQESYDYIKNPENDTDIFLHWKSHGGLERLDYETIDDVLEEFNIKIV